MNIDGKTKVVGIIGHPISHTFSPLMHNAAFRALGLNYVYLPFEVRPDALEEAIHGIRALGMVGVNVTVPHKEACMAFLDEMTQQAQVLGAVNTIVLHEGLLVGYNTDGQGFLRFLKEDFSFNPKGKKAMVLGAGGAARAVVASLMEEESGEVVVANRSFHRATCLCMDMVRALPSYPQPIPVPLPSQLMAEHLDTCQLLINATSVGMRGQEALPLEPALLHEGLVVVDLIYNPAQTMLLVEAQKRGLKCANGLGMLLYQGAVAFEKWTGQHPPIEVMRKALEEAF